MDTLYKVYFTGFFTLSTLTITLISMAMFLITTINPEVEVKKGLSSNVVTPSFDKTVSTDLPGNYLLEEERPRVWL